MSYGEVTKKNVLVLSEIIPDPEVPVDENPFKKCCYDLNVFASILDADKFKNDYSSSLKIFPINYGVTMYLQKLVDGGWVSKVTLNNNNYGTYYARGFRQVNNNNYVGYKIDWRSVLADTGNDLGEGKYRIHFDGATADLYSYEYCLAPFSQAASDQTVRITWMWNSVIGDYNSQKIRDFVGMGWLNQIRYSNSIFGFKTAPFTTESVLYNSGKEISYKKEFRESYKLELRYLPDELAEIVLYDILQADDIWITDYNSENNSGKYIEQNVEINGEYSPSYKNKRPELLLELDFIDKFNLRQKKYS
tara:strand:- start:267 stop:1181 length:915 start_codon:yes stop_codon:yes gene_type:complete